MDFIPPLAQPLLLAFAATFTHPTFQRWLLLLAAAILTPGGHTITNLLRTVSVLATGHPSSYHRVFSHRRWALWGLGRAWAGFILTHWVPEGPGYVAGDDTVDEHPGRKVFAKARHRDPVRSSHTFTAWRWGHKWGVLSLLVKFAFATRPWALPVLVVLYRSEEWNRQHGRRHRTPATLMRQLLAVWLHWFPERHFIFAGDGSYGTHALARFAHQQRRHLTLVSRCYPHANLYAPPPAVSGKPQAGRPRLKGAKQLAPQQVVAGAKRCRLKVRWYGGTTRKVEVVSGTGHWDKGGQGLVPILCKMCITPSKAAIGYKGGQGLVPILWGFVHDLTGTHRDEYFFTTEVTMPLRQLIETYTGRWSIETTFQELRAYLGLETTRGRTQATVLRAAPCLFGLLSVVVVLYALLPASYTRAARVLWCGQSAVTFSDAITAVRRWIWVEWIFVICGHKETFTQLPGSLRNLLLYALAPIA